MPSPRKTVASLVKEVAFANWQCTTIWILGSHTLLIMNRYMLIPFIFDGARCVAHFLLFNYVSFAMLIAHSRTLLTNPGYSTDFLDADLVKVMRAEYERIKDIAIKDAISKITFDSYKDYGHYTYLVKEASKACPFQSPATRTSRGQHKWWCSNCETFKPRHAHHCRSCKRCVLEMDHHCPWVNNCVGWRNHKYYVLFVSHGWLASGYAAALIACSLVKRPPGAHLWEEPEDYARSLVGRLLLYEYLPPPEALHTSIPVMAFCICLIMANLLLFFFASLLCLEQWQYMAKGYGVIDRKQLARAAQSAAAEAEREERGDVDEAEGLMEPGPVQLWQVLGAGCGRCGNRCAHVLECNPCPDREDLENDGVRVYAKKSLHSLVLRSYVPGSQFRGRREGSWVALTDRPGFVQIQEDDDFSKISVRRSKKRMRPLSKLLCCGNDEFFGFCRFDKLPYIMGEPLSLRWLCPRLPRPLDLAVVPEDRLVREARRRYAEASPGPTEESMDLDEGGERSSARRRSPDELAGSRGVCHRRDWPGLRPPPLEIYEYEDSDDDKLANDCC